MLVKPYQRLIRPDSYRVLYIPFWMLDASSFMSRDVYGYLVTRSGALWMPQGHSLDGIDDSFSLPTSIFSGTGAISIEAVVRFTVGNDGVTRGVWGIGTGVTGPPGQALAIYKQSDTGQIAVAVYGDAGAISTNSFNDNSWHHIVGVFSGGNVQTLSIDGKQDTTGSASYNVVAGSHFIGRTVATQFWSGQIAEVLIYNQALLPIEIQNNYLAAKRRMPWL